MNFQPTLKLNLMRGLGSSTGPPSGGGTIPPAPPTPVPASPGSAPPAPVLMPPAPVAGPPVVAPGPVVTELPGMLEPPAPMTVEEEPVPA